MRNIRDKIDTYKKQWEFHYVSWDIKEQPLSNKNVPLGHFVTQNKSLKEEYEFVIIAVQMSSLLALASR